LIAVEFPSRYGGNIRVYLGNVEGSDSNESVDLDELFIKEKQSLERFKSLRQNMEQWRRTKKQFLDAQVRKHGKLRAKAFPGRAAILIKLLELDEEQISVVYEKPGSLKIGHYLPGTRIPICSDEDLFSRSDKDLPLLNLAWHIPTEIANYMAEHDYPGPIIDILGAEDFPEDR
jgi:hypothetical protein